MNDSHRQIVQLGVQLPCNYFKECLHIDLSKEEDVDAGSVFCFLRISKIKGTYYEGAGCPSYAVIFYDTVWQTRIGTPQTCPCACSGPTPVHLGTEIRHT